ncbi:hypothetical protein ACOSQ3_003018 [Xanthoceras sorbifolium]
MAIDRISDLPDGVVYTEILSLLDAKEVVQTCVLSRAWRELRNDINILSFKRHSFIPEKNDAFRNFIYHVLSHRQPSKVSMSATINSVFCYATSHKVMEVETDVRSFPKNLMESQTLKTLKVSCRGYFTLENPLGFKFLTTSQISEVSMSKCSDFFSNCKNLEMLGKSNMWAYIDVKMCNDILTYSPFKDLELTNCNVCNLKINSNTFSIKAPSLVNLIIKNLKHKDGKFIKSLETLHVSSPRLKYFEFNGLLIYLPKVLNMCECKALEEVKFNMRDPLVSLQEIGPVGTKINGPYP